MDKPSSTFKSLDGKTTIRINLEQDLFGGWEVQRIENDKIRYQQCRCDESASLVFEKEKQQLIKQQFIAVMDAWTPQGVTR